MNPIYLRPIGIAEVADEVLAGIMANRVRTLAPVADVAEIMSTAREAADFVPIEAQP
ncbi:MAG: hypothetical protein J0M02_03855 [Planctomycetes bacterium]|nr:hypothetical protein [Planctomycetota bacterium]